MERLIPNPNSLDRLVDAQHLLHGPAGQHVVRLQDHRLHPVLGGEVLLKPGLITQLVIRGDSSHLTTHVFW